MTWLLAGPLGTLPVTAVVCPVAVVAVIRTASNADKSAANSRLNRLDIPVFFSCLLRLDSTSCNTNEGTDTDADEKMRCREVRRTLVKIVRGVAVVMAGRVP